VREEKETGSLPELFKTIIFKYFKAEDIQDSDEIAFGALDGSIDSSDEPVEELIVDRLGERISSLASLLWSMQDVIEFSSNFNGAGAQCIRQSTNINFKKASCSGESGLGLCGGMDFASLAIGKEGHIAEVQDAGASFKDPIDVIGAEAQELKGSAVKRGG
jgi:hypothetical protein